MLSIINWNFGKYLWEWLSIVEGIFGQWKTLFMVQCINTLYKNRQNIIFTNIKLKKHLAPEKNANIFYFEDNDFEQIVKLANNMTFQNNPALIKRGKRLRFYVFLDEGAIMFNSTDLQKYERDMKDLDDYIYQLRKLNFYWLIWIQRRERFLKKLRENVDLVIYFKPLFNWTSLRKYIWQYRYKVVDWSIPWSPTIYEESQNWEKVYFDYRIWWIWKPSIYSLYDDLYLNSKYWNSALTPVYETIFNELEWYFNQHLGYLKRLQSNIYTKDLTLNDFKIFTNNKKDDEKRRGLDLVAQEKLSVLQKEASSSENVKTGFIKEKLTNQKVFSLWWLRKKTVTKNKDNSFKLDL